MQNTTYIRGDLAEYTGEVQQVAGGTFYSVRIVEGHRAGEVAVTSVPPIGREEHYAAVRADAVARWNDEQDGWRRLKAQQS